MDAFLLQETNRSWRNLLSLNNNEFLKSVRKSTMIWSLNRLATATYLTNAEFRNYIFERLVDPHLQLRLTVSHQSTNSFCVLEEQLQVNRIGYLSLDSSLLECLPSCDSLHTLSLRYCGRLRSVGNYKNLTTLKICYPLDLKSTGAMERLSDLFLMHTDKSILQLLPRTNLVRLGIHHCLNIFLKKIEDFQGLKCLWLFDDRANLPILPLPSLEHLTVRSCQSVNLRGLNNLNSLDVDEISARRIFGKEEIYPLLNSLAGSRDSFLDDDMRKYPNLKSFRYNSITNLSSLEQLKQYESFPNGICLSQTAMNFRICTLKGLIQFAVFP
jgi:hypothetical protein